MENRDFAFNPEVSEKWFSRIAILKELFPDIGIASQEMPTEQGIAIFNTVEPPAMQFKPKTLDAVKKLATELKETISSSIHLPSPKFDQATGRLEHKQELLNMLQQKFPHNLDLITMHLGWKNADLVVDEQGNWKDTALANTVADELADLCIAGIQSGKTMTLENVRYKKHKHGQMVLLGSRPEHLIVARTKIAQIVATKLNMPVDEVLSRIGYTFDLGHAVGNAHLTQQYPIKDWLAQLGANIRLMHIHDVRPMLKDGVPIEKTHLAIGEGIIDWKAFLQAKKQYCPNATMILELDEVATIKSIDYLAKLEQ